MRAAFDQLCSRYSGRVQQIADELLAFSAGLFDISVVDDTSGSPWRMPTGFRYKFWDMPPSLFLVRNALVLALPGAIGQPILLRDAQRRAADLVSMQAGRLSHDFEQRIKANLRDFRNEIATRVEATLSGIEAAIDKGKSMRLQGEQSLLARGAELSGTLAVANDLRGRIDRWVQPDGSGQAGSRGL